MSVSDAELLFTEEPAAAGRMCSMWDAGCRNDALDWFPTAVKIKAQSREEEKKNRSSWVEVKHIVCVKGSGGGGCCWWPHNLVLVGSRTPLDFLLHRHPVKSNAVAVWIDPAYPNGRLHAEKIMNWKIKEFTVRTKSMRKELALLVKHGGVSTSDLPRASAFNLYSHPTIHPPTLQACRLYTACYTEANAAGYRQNHPRLKPPHSPQLCWGAGQAYSHHEICCFTVNFSSSLLQTQTHAEKLTTLCVSWPSWSLKSELRHSNFRPWWENTAADLLHLNSSSTAFTWHNCQCYLWGKWAK